MLQQPDAALGGLCGTSNTAAFMYAHPACVAHIGCKPPDGGSGLQEGTYDGRPHSMCVYTPSRTVAVYAQADTCDAHSDQGPLGIPGLGVKDRGPFFER